MDFNSIQVVVIEAHPYEMSPSMTHNLALQYTTVIQSLKTDYSTMLTWLQLICLIGRIPLFAEPPSQGVVKMYMAA